MKKTETIEFRVRYQETDQMGVVYYANYLVWFEMVRTEFFRSRGLEYKKLEDDDRIFVPVIESHCRYKSPLRYDDIVSITAELSEINTRYMSFKYEIRKGNRVTSTGSTKHAFVNEKGKAIKIPERIINSLSV